MMCFYIPVWDLPAIKTSITCKTRHYMNQELIAWRYIYLKFLAHVSIHMLATLNWQLIHIWNNRAIRIIIRVLFAYSRLKLRRMNESAYD